jgi:hypothetical protein
MTIGRFAIVLMTAVVVTALSNCGTLAPDASPPKPAPFTGSDAGVATYLETLNRLANSDPAQQADVFYEVERAYTAAPTTANTLRHAIALVTPGHPSSNLAEGKKLLEQLLATPERLVPAERNLAAFLVKDADIRLQLQADIRRLTATVDERTRGQVGSDKRSQSQAEEIAKLKHALQDAQHKLDAIISTEKSLSERSRPPATAREPSARD